MTNHRGELCFMPHYAGYRNPRWGDGCNGQENQKEQWVDGWLRDNDAYKPRNLLAIIQLAISILSIFRIYTFVPSWKSILLSIVSIVGPTSLQPWPPWPLHGVRFTGPPLRSRRSCLSEELRDDEKVVKAAVAQWGNTDGGPRGRCLRAPGGTLVPLVTLW